MHKIAVEILADSCFKVPILKISKKNTFVTGEKYDLRIKIRNLDIVQFPGGVFDVRIIWANQMEVSWLFTVNALKPGEEKIVKYGLTDVLSDGAALFMAYAKDTNGQVIDFYDFAGNVLFPQKSGYTHIYSIIPKNAEALYQLWALLFAVISFIASIVVDVILYVI
jgi:hypothetical protein